jgi:hypothetical protein
VEIFQYFVATGRIYRGQKALHLQYRLSLFLLDFHVWVIDPKCMGRAFVVCLYGYGVGLCLIFFACAALCLFALGLWPFFDLFACAALSICAFMAVPFLELLVVY